MPRDSEKFSRAQESSSLSLEDILARDPMLEMGPELVSAFAAQIIERLTERGLVIHKNPQEVYRQRWGTLLVRRESPQRLTEALLGQKDLAVGFGQQDFGEKYLNAAVWDYQRQPETLRWAVQEGFSKGGGLFMVEAFDPKGADLVVEKIDTPIKQLQTPTEVIDRTTYRAVSGKIHPEDLRFVLLGVVGQRFPKELMTDEEKDRLEEYDEAMEEWQANQKKGKRPVPFFVLRAFTFDRQEAAAA